MPASAEECFEGASGGGGGSNQHHHHQQQQQQQQPQPAVKDRWGSVLSRDGLVGRQSLWSSKKESKGNDPVIVEYLDNKATDPVAPVYRLKRILVRKTAKRSIDSIKFEYDDKSEWSYGHGAGNVDPRIMVLTSGEYVENDIVLVLLFKF